MVISIGFISRMRWMMCQSISFIGIISSSASFPSLFPLFSFLPPYVAFHSLLSIS